MDQDVLRISNTDEDDVTIVRLTGELDSMNVGDLTAAFNALLNRDRRLFVLDLGGLEFIDSAGLGGLVSIWERTMEQGCFIALASESTRVREVLQITGLCSVLRSYGNVPQASEAVRSMLAAFPERAE